MIVAHGNGPQVGMIQKRHGRTHPFQGGSSHPCPLSVCVAMSQGYIGYDLQTPCGRSCWTAASKAVATVLTQVEVDPTIRLSRTPPSPSAPL